MTYNSKGELICSKTTFAQCSQVLKHKPLLDSLVEHVDIKAKNKGLMYVLLYELMLGPNKSIRGGGSLKRQLLARKERLETKLKEVQGNDTTTTQERQFVTIPRYVRTNTLFSNTMKVLQQMKGFQAYIDPHIPDVIVLPHNSTTRERVQDLVTSHQVVLQDKSSCFSALCLVHGFDNDLGLEGDILDACAAPGNKTSHLASLLDRAGLQNNIHAFDRSEDRFKLLRRRMQELTKGKVTCHKVDFLATGPNDKEFSNISAIMLDPSCSGSGMISNHQETTINRDPSFCNDRIKTLANFQLKALQHATSKFPKVQRVVYSTCSVYIRENEGVVQQLLQSTNGWELVAPKCLKTWERRGLGNNQGGLTEAQAQCLIRVNPEEDGTNGFFVACFQRKEHKANNKSVISYISPSLPEGMAYYKGEFDTSKSRTIEEKEMKENDTFKGPTQRSKRKEPTVDVTTNGGISSKKRAKKLEWKRRQRQKKLERLQKQDRRSEEP